MAAGGPDQADTALAKGKAPCCSPVTPRGPRSAWASWDRVWRARWSMVVVRRCPCGPTQHALTSEPATLTAATAFARQVSNALTHIAGLGAEPLLRCAAPSSTQRARPKLPLPSHTP